MSIYATFLNFEDDLKVQRALAKEGINFKVIGGEMERDAPYVYSGSHRIGSEAHRDGYFSLSYAVPWCAQELWVRVDVAENYENQGPCTVLLSERQVRELHETLGHVLEHRDKHWELDQQDNVVLREGETREDHFAIYVPTDNDIQQEKDKRNRHRV